MNNVFYEIYPLGFSDCPKSNDGIAVPRIRRVIDWIAHFRRLGINIVYFAPVFSSSTHGYDTSDYMKLDERLGSNKDFQDVCWALKENGIRIMVDGVFNHVGRSFWAFQDVIRNKKESRYASWFYIDWDRNSLDNDGFFYEGWEGHYELVKLNLENKEVRDYLISAIEFWHRMFGIDALRLDVAYSLNRDFLREVRTLSRRLGIMLVGEVIHGDLREYITDMLLESATGYECYKGIYSSFNDNNMFEIDYSLRRLFSENGIYRGLKLMSFLDNHDVSRIASKLNDIRHLRLSYAIMMTMPGYPSIYYGSEWGEKADKTPGTDWNLRPSFDAPHWNELTDYIARLISIRSENPELAEAAYERIFVDSSVLIYRRGDIITAINASSSEYYPHLWQMNAIDLVSREAIELPEYPRLSPFSASIWKML